MSRQVTVEVWTEDETRDFVYSALTESIQALSFVSPRPTLEDVTIEVEAGLSMFFDEAYYGSSNLDAPVEFYAGVLTDICMAQRALTDVLAEIEEAYNALYLTPQPSPQGL